MKGHVMQRLHLTWRVYLLKDTSGSSILHNREDFQMSMASNDSNLVIA